VITSQIIVQSVILKLDMIENWSFVY